MRGGIDGAGKFGVDEQREARAEEMRKSGAKLLFGDHGETVDAGVNKKTFEAGDARVGEELDVVLIISDDAAPREPIDAGAPLRGFAFGVERGNIRGGGQTIERHVDEKRVTSRGSGARGGFEPFPIGAAGIVDVNVRIDEAGENDGVAKIVRFGVARDLIRSNDVMDATVFFD